MKYNLTKLDFPICLKSSKSLVAGDLFFWYCYYTAPKLGISVSKSYGKAHDRNLFKRRCRSLFKNMSFIHQNICIIVKPRRKLLAYSQLLSSFNKFESIIND
ncbi:MAG: ribonuclease P protein component [Fidelibacterota bacterium]